MSPAAQPQMLLLSSWVHEVPAHPLRFPARGRPRPLAGPRRHLPHPSHPPRRAPGLFSSAGHRSGSAGGRTVQRPGVGRRRLVVARAALESAALRPRAGGRAGFQIPPRCARALHRRRRSAGTPFHSPRPQQPRRNGRGYFPDENEEGWRAARHAIRAAEQAEAFIFAAAGLLLANDPASAIYAAGDDAAFGAAVRRRLAGASLA